MEKVSVSICKSLSITFDDGNGQQVFLREGDIATLRLMRGGQMETVSVIVYTLRDGEMTVLERSPYTSSGIDRSVVDYNAIFDVLDIKHKENSR